MDNTEQRIIESIRSINVAEIAADLIRIPSYTGLPRQEEQVAEYIADFFRNLGIAAELSEAAPGRPNIIARLPGSGGTRSLMLCGHMDTVPPYDMEDPFSGNVSAGRLLGRGSCDMKGPLASMMAAIAGIAASGVKLDSELIFAGLADEEGAAIGVRALTRTGPVPSACIVGEPTEMNIAPGHKGLEWIKVIVHGKKVHSGIMEQGVNAVSLAANMIGTIIGDYGEELLARNHNILGHPTINIGTISGGDQPSTVPDYCEFALDRRLIPGEATEQVYDELWRIAEWLSEGCPDLRIEIMPYNDVPDPLILKPYCIDSDRPIIIAAQDAIRKLCFDEKMVRAFPAWSDAGTIYEYMKADTIVMGPGELELAHTANESIAVHELATAAKIYALTALHYCGSAE